MPIAVPKATMLSVEEILRTALAEHDSQTGPAIDLSEAHARALTALDSPGTVSLSLASCVAVCQADVRSIRSHTMFPVLQRL